MTKEEKMDNHVSYMGNEGLMKKFDELNDSHVIRSRGIRMKIYLNDCTETDEDDQGKHCKMIMEVVYYVNFEKVALCYVIVMATDDKMNEEE